MNSYTVYVRPACRLCHLAGGKASAPSQQLSCAGGSLSLLKPAWSRRAINSNWARLKNGRKYYSTDNTPNRQAERIHKERLGSGAEPRPETEILFGVAITHSCCADGGELRRTVRVGVLLLIFGVPGEARGVLAAADGGRRVSGFLQLLRRAERATRDVKRAK